jgi:hypothetical protein
MELFEYLETTEVKEVDKNITKRMWADNNGHIFMEPNNIDGLEDYIIKHYDKIKEKYHLRVPKSKITVENVIQELGWFAIVLTGRKKSYNFKKNSKDIRFERVEYYSCFIYGDNIIKPENITLEAKVKELALRIKGLYPTINEFKSNKPLKL